MDRQRVKLVISKEPKEETGSEEILTREQLIPKINSYSEEAEFMVTFDFGPGNGITENKGNKDGQQ